MTGSSSSEKQQRTIERGEGRAWLGRVAKVVGFEDLKKRAASAGSSISHSHNKNSGPSTKYVPVRPHDVAGQVPLTPAERAARSNALQAKERTAHRPAPPPIRSKPSSLSSPSRSSAPASPGPVSPPPALPRRTSTPRANPAVGKAPPPPLPAGRSPAPTYEQATSEYGYEAPYEEPAPPPRAMAPPPVGQAPAPPLRSGSSWRPPARTASPVQQDEGAFKPFSAYDSQDKQHFFSAMDHFFAARADLEAVTPAILAASRANAPDANPYRSAMSTRRSPAPIREEPAPPPVALSTRPSYSSSAPIPSTRPTRSYPPAVSHSSSALSLLHYILYATFDTPWYNTSSPVPPILVGRSDLRMSFAMSQRGSQKETTGVCLAGDASIAWWHLTWDVRSPTDVRREGRYRPIPSPWDGQRLYEAAESYGPHLVRFAQNAVASRRPVARGECWDVASEALNSVPSHLPPPFPAIGRTHGHLLYYGEAKSGGVWHGGDAYLRPGDIVEWRTVRLNMPGGGWAKLGDPDHTAVVLSATAPTGDLPQDGEPYHFSSLGSVTVVEQSQGVLPAEQTYDLAGMTEGEVWFYRPVGLTEFVGAEIVPEWPVPFESWEVGQLE